MYILDSEPSSKRFWQNLGDIAKEWWLKVWFQSLNITFVHHQKTGWCHKENVTQCHKVLMLKLVSYQTLAFLVCLLIYHYYHLIIISQLFWKMLMPICQEEILKVNIFPAQPWTTHPPTATKSLCNHQVKDTDTEELCLTPNSTSFTTAGPLGIRAGGEENKWPMKETGHPGSHSNIWGNGKEFTFLNESSELFSWKKKSNDGNKV